MNHETVNKDDFKVGDKVQDYKGNTFIVSSKVGNEVYVESEGRVVVYYPNELSKITE